MYAAVYEMEARRPAVAVPPRIRQAHEGASQHRNVRLHPFTFREDLPTEPISIGGSSEIRLTPVAPFEHPQRATHDSGSHPLIGQELATRGTFTYGAPNFVVPLAF